jgi:hypothetical protein
MKNSPTTKIQKLHDGTIEQYKTQLISKRYTQTYGIDYYEIFASVTKINIIRILFYIAVNQGGFYIRWT